MRTRRPARSASELARNVAVAGACGGGWYRFCDTGPAFAPMPHHELRRRSPERAEALCGGSRSYHRSCQRFVAHRHGLQALLSEEPEMSSFTRRLTIRAMKRAGMRRDRQEWLIPGQVRNPTFGKIVDNNGDAYGIHWPRAIPERFA